MTMGNRSRYHRPARGGEYKRGWQDGHHQGIEHGVRDAVHMLLADLPDSGVASDPDDEYLFRCDDGVCHGCELERRGFTLLASTWSNREPCERHP
jgi:hypothetical protein